MLVVQYQSFVDKHYFLFRKKLSESSDVGLRSPSDTFQGGNKVEVGVRIEKKHEDVQKIDKKP